MATQPRVLSDSGRVACHHSFRTCNVHVEPMDHDAAVASLVRLGLSAHGRAVHLCNAYTLSLTSRDAKFAGVVDRGDLNLTDGMPLALMGRHLGFDVHTADRPRGFDLVVDTAIAGQVEGLRHYLYGSRPTVVAALAERLQELAPGVEIVGVESPPFRPLEPAELMEVQERIRESGAHVVWVGLGTPKQDVFIDSCRDELDATLVGVGAAFDFIAGVKPVAPAWLRRAGLEWMFRLVSEPRRLWRRYLVGHPLFLAGLLRSGVKLAS